MKTLSLFICFIIFSPLAHAQLQEGTYEFVIRKQEKKEENRWSLAEWYETKNKMKLQDMWLALNSSDNPFEFFVGYENNNYSLNTNDNGVISESSYRKETYSFDAFANIVGLHYEMWNTSEDTSGWSADFKVRVLGTSNQNTNLTVSYGIKTSEDKSGSANPQTYENNTLGASLTIYLMKHFGLTAEYSDMQSKTNAFGTNVSGLTTSYEAFIDYGLVRVFGGNRTTSETYAGATTTTQDTKTSHFGVKVFF